MASHKTLTLVSTIIILFAVSIFFATIKSNVSRPTILASLHGHTLRLELALTDQEKYQGLSDRSELCADCGMLFRFSKKQIQTFVMRRMNFPLDIVWLNDKKVVGISKNLQPEHAEPYSLYPSNQSVNNVLELNGGISDKLHIQVGDELSIYEN